MAGFRFLVVLFQGLLTCGVRAQVETRVLKGSFLLATGNVDSNGNEFLSADQSNQQVVGTTTQDAGTGRQRWKLVYGGPDFYFIVVGYGTSGSYDFLGSTDVTQSVVFVAMYPRDDGSGLQRWQLYQVPNSTNSSYYIRPYLAALSNSSLWLTQNVSVTGNRTITMTRNATAGPGSQWQPLQFAGEYNLINRGSYLSGAVSQAGVSVLSAAANDNGSGQQRVQLLQRLDGLYYILIKGTNSQFKYLSILPGSPAQAYLDVRRSLNSVTWVVTSSTSGSFTIQDSRYGFYLTLPSAAGSAQFLASGYVADGSLNWALQPATAAPGGNCISNVGNGQFLQGPLGSSWVLMRGPAANWYQIKSASSQTTYSYLSLGLYGTFAPLLVPTDDGSGAQRWEINRAPVGYYIQPWSTTNVSGRYLAAGSQLPIGMVAQTDGTNLQSFYINQCPPAPSSSLSSAGAIAIGCVFGLGGGLLLVAAATYYYYTRYYLKSGELGDSGEPDISKAENGNEMGAATFMDCEDIKLDLNDAPEPNSRPSRCFFFNSCIPGRSASII